MKHLIPLLLLALLVTPGVADAKKKKKKDDLLELGPPPGSSRQPVGVEKIMGKDARTVMAIFGRPVLDVREDTARKLQFSNRDCVLDTYLYPPSLGKDAVVTYIAARIAEGRDAGRDAERNSCIASLSRG
jgi:hypothetical protein